MSARKPAMPELDPETGRLLGELIGVLAGMCREADERGLLAGRPTVARRRLASARSMRPVALALARCAAAQDAAGTERLLAVTRPASQWRELALLLASAADVERLAPAPVRQAEELPFPEAKDTAA